MKDLRQKEKGAAEDEIRQLHYLNGHEFEQTLGDSGDQNVVPKPQWEFSAFLYHILLHFTSLLLFSTNCKNRHVLLH